MSVLTVLPHRLRRFARQFAKDGSGSVAVEAVLILPFLLWAFLASFVYYDAFRQSSINLKAAYTIGDMLSRETAAVNDAYVNSLQSLFAFLAKDGSDPAVRVSVARWDEDDDRYELDWSEGRADRPPLSEENINAMRDRLPNLPDNERVILVETWSTYKPTFNVGLKEDLLYNLVFTSPRFAPQLVWEN
ncbi:hypothetical protein TL5118_00090 [Thalassovita autumnalis]|uniref:Flp pilus assembly protein TadG n=1 Tax=Thalassovita autumnalis TaxID=2072972 RepID=A0A0P1FPT9_9RHOB|nr:hypothetical protein [Thalassovita autumnalis]CUH62597.1 hypothetical protein TL5118_00090 [Thalassovita autumnalis]CUH70348.1 hypothetical protein TL5120_00121 [Thalassovita autumnalis]